jgi:AraC-like DNA-binding protein/DNA gyrase inhibitor GyrI
MKEAGMETSEIVQRAIDYIEDCLYEPLSLESIAETAMMSVPNLYRLFYAMTGHPIKEYVRKRRISEAANLLRFTDQSTIDIGIGCGFQSYQTFIKSFKRSTGLTPGQYRQAGVIFSFERINLHERVTYLEEREVFDRFPDVKVIRLAPQKGIGYLHAAEREAGIEDEALIQFHALLEMNGLDTNPLRLFGWNVDRAGSQQPFGYQLAAVGGTKNSCMEDTNLRPVELPGGLYAVTHAPAGSGRAIVDTWSRMVSDWLPRSTFELGKHPFLEEYQQFGKQIARLKLYLPVERRHETETIDIVERSAVKVISFHEEGEECVARADQASVEWLRRNGFIGDNRIHVFMSCSFPADETMSYEVDIAPPDQFIPSQEDLHRIKWLEGGLYACITTRAYGSMSGVLERIYRWLDNTPGYRPDGNRSWYSHYLPYRESKLNEGNDFERSVYVECCVPVILIRDKT